MGGISRIKRVRVDKPLSLDPKGNSVRNFDIIRKNIDFLWFREEAKEKKSVLGGRLLNAAAQQTTPTPIPPTPTFDYPEHFSGYNTPGGTYVDQTETDLTLGQEARKDSVFTHTLGSAEVTILKSADYKIEADAGFGLNEGDYIEIAVMVDDGSGYKEVPGSLAYCGA